MVENISRNIRDGRYGRPDSSWFASAGFYFGMLHGGWIVQPSGMLVVLTDHDFAMGDEQGRQNGQYVTDKVLTSAIHQWALSSIAAQALAYELGKLTGMLSRVLISALVPVVSIP